MSRKKTREQVIEEFIKVHGHRYDYSPVDYKNIDTKTKIICPDHGIFEQTPYKHLTGQGCPKCAKLQGGKSQKKNIEQIIEGFRKAHGDRYDYSLVAYVNIDTKVKIICPEHGLFEQTPYAHLNGSRCPLCVGNVRYNNEQIIAKFREVHGNRYDYSQIDYDGNKVKIKITCPDHGEFDQTPSMHFRGQGCPKCANLQRGESQRNTTAQIIAEFKTVHGDKYDYSEMKYVNINSNVRIICRDHGFFEQTPYKHLIGRGCSVCGGNIRFNSQSIIARFKAVHGDKYDYSQLEYVNIDTKVKIICLDHGVFEQTPSKHLIGRGCSICGGNIRFDNQSIIARFKAAHGDKYDYSHVEYVNVDTKVKIICPYHGVFEQTPYKHLTSQGCPTCNIGWSKEKIIQFISSIDNHDLLHMDAIELQMIINQGKLPDALNELVFSDDANRDNTLKALKEKLQDALNSGVEEVEELAEEDFPEPEEMDVDEVEEADLLVNSKSEPDSTNKELALISLSENFEDLHVLDNALVASCDEEAVEFLIQYKLRKLWNQVLNDVIHVEKLKAEQGGRNFNILKEHFFDEYNEVIAWQPPQDYRFPYPCSFGTGGRLPRTLEFYCMPSALIIPSLRDYQIVRSRLGLLNMTTMSNSAFIFF